MRPAFLLVAAALIAAPAIAATQRSDLGNAETLMKLYPPRALAAGEEGLVGFEVQLDKAGHPTSCAITQSSGFPRLDQETCTVITQHAVFAANPGVGSGSSAHKGQIAWKLPAGRTPTTLAANAAADKPAKTICKRVPVTGSNARFERVCMSSAQWAEAQDDTKSNYSELQGKGFTQGQ